MCPQNHESMQYRSTYSTAASTCPHSGYKKLTYSARLLDEGANPSASLSSGMVDFLKDMVPTEQPKRNAAGIDMAPSKDEARHPKALVIQML